MAIILAMEDRHTNLWLRQSGQVSVGQVIDGGLYYFKCDEEQLDLYA